MALHTTKQSRSGYADISFKGDDNTGLVSTANNHIGVMSAGQQVAAHGTDGAGTVWRMPATVRVALAAADTAGGVLAWANPMGASIIVTRVVFDVTTAATGACTLDVGVASGATTSSDTAMDGLDVNSATGTFDNIENQGTNGKSALKMTSSQYLTASKASGAAAGLAGYAYITFHLI